MRSKMFEQGEVLKYEECLISQPVYNDAWEAVGYMRNDDLIIVVQDQTTEVLKVMLPNGKSGWVRCVSHRLLRLEHARPVTL